ncbi:hypothetical protein K3G63_19360 [Hymenobacter sp. HSC-4F20]|uniref:hypothetical protein n=1 Tax=Hymenobacter sp. HSC-4F20 TaxID=2864135 RepID=UPI001C72AB95|nr:hypothetical protein [Hymenobacter sp. HSC-4F20]MBX0292611.1 hypothetical protein [Hymenobacter sp. HSC-4F20]
MWEKAQLDRQVLDQEIGRLLRARLDRLLRMVPKEFPGKGAAKWWCRINYWLAKDQVLDTVHKKILHKIRQELETAGLLK